MQGNELGRGRRREHRGQPVRPVGRFAGGCSRRGDRPTAGHGQDQTADVPGPVLRAHALSGSHVPDVRRARPVRRHVTRHDSQRGRELGAVCVLRPVPADRGRHHRGPGRQADECSEQRGGRLRGVLFFVHRPVSHRTDQN